MVKMFIEDFKEVEYIVSHNARFDLLVLQGDLIRNGFEYSLKGKKINCTMLNTTRLCKLRKTTGHSGYKWPKLEELIGYIYLSNPKFNLKLKNAHDASFDVRYTAKCYYELLKREYEFKNNYRKVWEYISLPKNLSLLKPSQNLNEHNDYEQEKVNSTSPNFLKFVIGFSLVVLIISVYLNTTDNDKNRQINYTTEDVNLRLGPSYSDPVKEVLLKGEKVFSSDSIVNGYKIILNEDNSIRGWISESYLEE